MDNTTRQTLIFENNSFFMLTPMGKEELSHEQLQGLKPGYVIIISDTELFYTTMDFPDAPKRKLNLFITNYLLGSFPQNLCEKFCYLSKGDKILIGIFNLSFAEVYEKYAGVFSKALYITSPLAVVYSRNDNFHYKVGGFGYAVEDGIISQTEELSDPLEPDYTPDPDAKLTVPFIRTMATGLHAFKIPAAVLLICYLLFAAGEYMRYAGVKGNLVTAEKVLNDIYTKAGVQNSKDPYGMLLSKAGREENSATYKTLTVLELVSKAHNENINTNSLEIKDSSVVLQGTAADFTFLEQFQQSLSKETGKDVQIVDTARDSGTISFTVRFDI